MLNRTFAFMAMAVALTLVVGLSATAADNEKVHDGKIVKVAEGKLTMTDKDGKNEHTHMVGADATVTCDGKACKLEDLKAGAAVKVTMKDDQKVTKVEAQDEGQLTVRDAPILVITSEP